MQHPLFVFAAILVLNFSAVFATHQRAGEITYRHISGLTYEFQLVTFTYTPSPADRPQLLIDWGDGESLILDRSLEEIISTAPPIKKNVYTGTHTYQSPGTYTIFLEDPNRNAGVLNIPGSVNIPFYIESVLVINPFLGPNNSVVLLTDPVQNACVEFPYIFNPGAFDIDGDSLSYELIPCRGAEGQLIAGYTFPPALNNIFQIDPVTGDIYWDSPPLIGEYNIAIKITEWRNGFRIGSVVRDMQIHAVSCNNTPPLLSLLQDTCIVAGQTLNFLVEASDPDGDDIILTATGGPLVLEQSPAFFPEATGEGTVSALFSWTTVCDHVRQQPYFITFRVKDDKGFESMYDLKTIAITVIAPPPDELEAKPVGNGIQLNWKEEFCDKASGYHIYRKEESSSFVPDYCQTGLPAEAGFERITTLQGLNSTSYFDNKSGTGLNPGAQYCYRVVSFFPDGALSKVSEEVCSSLNREVPVLTHVDVLQTSESDGEIFLDWLPPLDIDTVLFPPPYQYNIFRSLNSNMNGAVLAGSTSGFDDTTFTDTGLNTVLAKYHYSVEIESRKDGNIIPAGTGVPASTVFLSTSPAYESAILKWTFQVPWSNYFFEIYRSGAGSQEMLKVGETEASFFNDTGLSNDSVYCYKVIASGRYDQEVFPEILINASQTSCVLVRDTLAPCPVSPEIQTFCETGANLVSWSNPCNEVISFYNIYHAPAENQDLIVIATVPGTQFSFLHEGLTSVAGCYAVTAVKETGSESVIDMKVCVDIDQCRLYSLPNVFTPDGDGINDFLIPFPYDFVEKIELQIFNRWGQPVFETTDPDINWDGKHKQTGNDLPEGVYYYICEVFEYRLSGLTQRTLTGVVHILRGTGRQNY